MAGQFVRGYMVADDWDSKVKAAKKLLGDKGDIPKPPAAAMKAIKADSKAYAEYKKVRDQLQEIVLTLQDTASAEKDAFLNFSDKIESSNLGLDPKNKDDAKNIAKAQDLLCGFLKEMASNCDENIKNLREVNKHLDNISKYKGPA